METTKTKWVIDPVHSEIAFKVKHLMISHVKGTFQEFDATVETDGDDFSTAAIRFGLNPASVQTGNPDRDGHLKSADFFDVENHGQLTFVSDTLSQIDDETYLLTGDLTIRGVAKRVKLNAEFGGIVKDPWGQSKAGFTLTGSINRKDFGLTWNAALEAGGVLVGEEVKITCEVELVKQS
ncbi:MAG: YceI family protein [Marinilabiliales bacterium]|nr:YceI family protein [Marinilabiliales bacterium]